MNPPDAVNPLVSGELFAHGGSRRRQAEVTHALSEAQCLRVLEAADAALHIDKPFNRWLTILWERGGLSGYDGTRATGAWLKLLGDWMRARGEKARWVYSHEQGVKNGIHVHILLHVPGRLDFQFRVQPRRWAAGLLPGRYTKGVVKTLKIPSCSNPDPYLRQLAVERLRAKLHYMLKAAPPELESKLGLQAWGEVRWGQSSTVYGKRAGSWQGWSSELKSVISPPFSLSHLD